MKFIRIAFVCVLFLLVFFINTKAQQTPDSVLFQESVSNLKQTYFSEIGNNAQLYHGIEYIRNGQRAVGFPFFESDNILKGYVSYQGTLYPDRNLYYDLVFDQLVTNNYTGNAYIALSTEKVDSFSLGSHVFVRIEPQPSSGLNKEGYYEQLYSGELSVFARREKLFISGMGSDDARYVEVNTYYIRINNVYYPVADKRSLLNLFKDHQDELKKYIRSRKLKFKKDLESSLVLSTIYYSQIKH